LLKIKTHDLSISEKFDLELNIQLNLWSYSFCFNQSNQNFLQLITIIATLLISVIHSLKGFIFMVYTYKRVKLKGFNFFLVYGIYLFTFNLRLCFKG
jgi:hypothetical protein